MGKEPLPEIFYHEKSGYWYKHGNRFRNLTTSIVGNLLIQADYSKERYAKGGHGLTELEDAFTRLTINNYVDYAGPLAGHRTGMYKTGDGRKILVTSEPRPTVFMEPQKPKDLDFEHLDHFLSTLLHNKKEGSAQFDHLSLWVKFGADALRDGSFRPGQMCCFAGKSDCGKSLLQALITEMFGGRMAKCYEYMIGETAFNADLCEAEHLVIEDDASSTDWRVRKHFGAKIKQFTVAEQTRVHGKGLKGITLRTYKRMTASCNDEPEELMVMPPLIESLMDKVNLYRCGMGEVPYPNDRARTWNTFMRELPAYLWYCHNLKVPEKWKDRRYGVRAYHNAELFSNLCELAPETMLLNLIDQTLDWHDSPAWKGSAEVLQNELRKKFPVQMDQLIKFPTATGVYLARLRAVYKDRFTSSSPSGKTTWTITAPAPTEEKE
jgi:hypothetical protein